MEKNEVVILGIITSFFFCHLFDSITRLCLKIPVVEGTLDW